MLTHAGVARTALVAALVAALLGAIASVADAQPAPARVVAIAPLSTLGAEDTSASTRELAASLEQAFAALPDTQVIPAAQVATAIRRAKRPQLRVCERDTECLAELGRLVGATVVIDGEVGGLGESRIVYLGATDVASGKELRSTTLALGSSSDPGGGPPGAAVRLLAPERYRGALRFSLDVRGATVHVNGSPVALSRAGDVALPVGTHAVRVTHPAYRDFVRFIDVPYGQTLEVPIAMQAYPIVQRDVHGRPVNTDRIEYDDPPVWRRWYVVGPAAVGLAVLAGILVGHLAHDFPDGDACRQVGGGACD